MKERKVYTCRRLVQKDIHGGPTPLPLLLGRCRSFLQTWSRSHIPTTILLQYSSVCRHGVDGGMSTCALFRNARFVLTSTFCFTGKKSETAALFLKSSAIFSLRMSLWGFSGVSSVSATHWKISWLFAEKKSGTMPSGTALVFSPPAACAASSDLAVSLRDCLLSPVGSGILIRRSSVARCQGDHGCACVLNLRTDVLLIVGQG